MDIRPQELFTERESVTFYLFTAHGKGGYKLSQQSMHGIHRDFPDAEESQNVVDAVGVKVFSHLLETFHPPFITVVLHHIPVIGGETPVLPVDREIIGWSTGLSVEVEIIRFCPGFYTVATDTDGDVPLQHYSMLAGISGGFEQLQVKIELDIEVDGDMGIVRRVGAAQFFNLLSIVLRVLGPFAEVRCMV